MTRLSRVNMYLHKFAKPQISEYDTLTSLDKWDDTYDVILANPPFMTPKGGIIPHNRYRVTANRSEVLFVDYIAEHLNPTGKAAVIVPEGIVFQSANAYKAIRKFLLEDNLLYAVISLPSGIFNPYSGVKTSILLFDKTLAKQKDEILFVKMSNDGYDLGAQRRDVKGSDIPEAIKILEDYKNGIDVSNNALVTMASKKDVAKQDYILVGERYKDIIVKNSDYPMVNLSAVCEIIRGITFSKNDQLQHEMPNSIKIATTKAAQEFGIIEKDLYNIPREYVKDNSKLLRNSDILISTANSLNMLGRTTYISNISFEVSFGAFMTLIRGNEENIHSLFLLHCLKAEHALQYFKDNANTTTNISNLSYSALSAMKIPLPPLHIQEEIVKEIEGYQKIIDGAKQVVDNYKPTIKIDPSWEMKNLGDICDVRDGTHDSPIYVYDGYPLITSKNIKNGAIDFNSVNYISYADYELINKRSKVDNGDIIMPMIGTIGSPIIVNTKKKFAIKNVALIKFINNSIMNKYVELVLNSRLFEEYINNTKRGGTQNFISLKDIRTFSIPVPPIEVQSQIIEQIDEENAIIGHNKRMIEIFEKKIKNRISEVWAD